MKPASRFLKILTLLPLAGLSACGTLIPTPTAIPHATDTLAPTGTATAAPTATLTPTKPPATPTDEPLNPINTGELFVLSITENGYQHLFLYAPAFLKLTHITDGEWDDITPAFSPNGSRIAFASNRSGVFDLYVLDLITGETEQLTDTPAYDASPSWSPDGQWIVHETYAADNLDIQIISATDPKIAPIPLDTSPAADHSPAWSPKGRQVAFVSTRSGNSEIWLANLDSSDTSRLANLSNTPAASESHPAWNADGARLAWASAGESERSIYQLDTTQPGSVPVPLASGDYPIWSADKIATSISQPNKNFLVEYDAGGLLALPLIPLPGRVRGLSVLTSNLPSRMPDSLSTIASIYPTPVWVPVVTGGEGIPAGRAALIELDKVKAPHPQLHDAVNDSFNALRRRVNTASGIDILGNLENAYVPLTSPPEPSMGEDWHVTGRAFSLNPVLLSVDWLVVIPEQYGSELFWHVFLRPNKQDGTLGEPLHEPPFNLNARYALDPSAYDKGGTMMESVPSGYWVDFTALAQSYGWERLPALPNWKSFFKGTRFYMFVMTNGLTWREAMLEIYPPEVLVTPTPVVPEP